MNYIGSKYKLLPFIENTIREIVSIPLEKTIFCDLFAGIGTVGKHFKPYVKKVISNDKEYYSFVLNRHYIGNQKNIFNKKKLITTLNNLNGIEDKIYTHYCLGGSKNRQYFSDTNGKKIDAIRLQIEHWKQKKKIDEDTYFFLLTCLLESADKVANTASVYGAYLKHLKKTAQKDFILYEVDTFPSDTTHKVMNTYANVLIEQIKGDILYLDPPYNAREYGANYHLLNTIASYQDFIPKGKTGLPPYTKSPYCKKNKAEEALEHLIKNAQFSYIFLSYNNEGLIHTDTIQTIFSKYGNTDLRTKTHQRFRADKPNAKRTYKNTELIEYIHILKK